jgi:AAA ATPase domain
VATARTREATGGFLIMEPLDASADLSPEREQQVYRVVGENQALSRWQLRAGHSLIPLIGREAELRAICQAWQRAQRGQGQVVGLVAGPGLGKSRLAHEFVARQQDKGVVVLESGALAADSNASFIVLKRLLHSLLGVGTGAPAEAIAAKLTIRPRDRGADARLIAPAFRARSPDGGSGMDCAFSCGSRQTGPGCDRSASVFGGAARANCRSD